MKGRSMLAPAHAGHLGLVRNLIRQGAIEGSFDTELAVNSPETELFFANLRHALLAGYFTETAAGGATVTLAAPGYVYAPDDGDREKPIGFGLFKSMGDLGYELWLTGVDPQWRGRGHGRAMITALLATPAGQMAHVVRVKRGGPSGNVMQRLLETLGFTATRDTTFARWFVRDDAPPAVAERIRHATLIDTTSH
jgi:ribosomal protein S18 acetylase RimI-like enzyme